MDTYEGLVQIELSIVDYEFCEDNSSAALTHCLEVPVYLINCAFQIVILSESFLKTS